MFVPKLRNNDMHKNGRGISGWYCWQSYGSTEKYTISIQEIMKKYNFNVCHFFRSDLFEKCLALFKKNIKTVVDKRLPEMLKSLPESSNEYK